MRLYLIVVIIFLVAACDNTPQQVAAPPTLVDNPPTEATVPDTPAATPVPDDSQSVTSLPENTVPPQDSAPLSTAVAQSASPVPDQLGSNPGERQEESTVPLITLPPPGTIIAPVTEDPNADLPFDVIAFEQRGGPNDMTLFVEIYNDGRMVRDGQTSTVPASEIIGLNNMLREMNFYGISGQFALPGGGDADTYYYRVSVQRGETSISIDAQDGYTPQPLLRLFAELSRLAQNV